MTISTRSSALAIKEETTEGTPVAPSASTDYVALQEGATMSPSVNTLENAELKASIGASKPILGLESPTFSSSLYLKGTAPNYGKTILKAAFGSETVASSEYDVVSATTSAITVDTGEGANFKRGDALLIKDGTNGYSIRSVKSVSGDVLTLGFNVSVAPSAGVLLGESVTYAPVNQDHPTLSVWHYIGNQGAVQMLSGGRVTDLSISVSAAELVTLDYTIEGNEYYFNPIELTSSNNRLDFDDGSGEENATIATGMYKDPTVLSQAIEDAMNALTSDTVTVTYSSSNGKFTIESDGATFELLFSTGTNTANTIAGVLGFATTDQTGATSYESDSAVDLSSPQTPTYDSAQPLAAKDHQIMIGNATDTACFNASSLSFSMGTPKSDILSICARSGKSGSIINSRAVTMEVTGYLNKYDVATYQRFREGSEIGLQYSFGTKTGTNWTAGSCGALYMPTATISSLEISETDSIAVINLTVTGFVNDSGDGEVFLSFV